jgi:hypothetical protein
LGGASGVGGKACASERFHTRIRAKPKRVGNNIAIEEGSGVAMFEVTVKFPTSAMLLSAFVVPYTLDVKQLKQPEGPQVHVVFTTPPYRLNSAPATTKENPPDVRYQGAAGKISKLSFPAKEPGGRRSAMVSPSNVPDSSVITPFVVVSSPLPKFKLPLGAPGSIPW